MLNDLKSFKKLIPTHQTPKTKTVWWLDPIRQEQIAQHPAGLSQTQASALIQQWGENTLKAHKSLSIFLQFITRFKNHLVIILLTASLVSAVTGEMANFVIIALMVTMSVTLDFVQEYKANESAEKLRLTVRVQTNVLRDGQSIEIPVEKVVPGDVVMLRAGDLVPADALILEARDFFVNQSLLTGEAFPIEKNSFLPPNSATELHDASNAVFMGTSVIGGSAKVLVIHTGMNTMIGEITQSIQQPNTDTSFELGTRRFGMLIMWLTFVLVLFVLFVNAWFHKPWLESFLFAVALAVGLTPELLPMVVSVTLSKGAIRLAKLKMIVKRQSAIQDLGSMDTFCTDKTGTLTEAKIRLEKSLDVQGRSSPFVLELAYLNSHFETGLKSPLDAAILEAKACDVSTWTKIDELPFDYQRRCVSVLVDCADKRWLVVKGAAEDVIKLCTTVHDPFEPQKKNLDEDLLARIQDQYHRLESDGLRVLGIAWREVSKEHNTAQLSDEQTLTLAGFTAFLDPPKVSASAALAKLQALGVDIKVITGDSPLVTQHVCLQLGLAVQGILLGKEVSELDDAALQRRVESANLFCRANPAQKQRIIMALKANGHVVGYMGDGINDAPSLHSADVGLSVDSAVDVAKSAADIILLEQDLNVIEAGVLEGRRTFGNIMKYIMMGTSSNFGNMFSMAGASLFLPFLPMLPTQILLNNILYDLSEIPIPLDEVDADEILKPRTLDLSFIRTFMLVIGPISSLFDFLTFYVLLNVLNADEKLFQTGWFVESLCTQVLVIFIIRTRKNPFQSKPHPLLSMTSIGIVLLAIALPMTPLGAFFGFVTPPAAFYAMLMALIVVYLFFVEVAKQLFYKWLRSRSTKSMGAPNPI